MIITRTPVRISFLGGGTDYPSWSDEHGGIVVGGAINKYAYHSVRFLPPFHEYKTRVVYSAIETVKSNLDIQHRAVKACIEHLGLQNFGYEIFHASDLPGRSGTGSSSAFVVGLLHALVALHGLGSPRLPHELMEEAITVEQGRMKEVVGCQDQAFAAYGKVNVIKFRKGGNIDVYSADFNTMALQAHLLLLFTGISRTASEIASTYVPSLCQQAEKQWKMMLLAEQGIEALQKYDFARFGDLMDQSWRIKSSFSKQISNPAINDAYVRARICGAWGGKLIGAGGGGCLLLVADPAKHAAIRAALPEFVHIPFAFDNEGSKVIFADKENIREYRPWPSSLT